MVGLTVTTKPAPPDSFLVACEEWRPVVGFETHYAVSSFGRVKRIVGGKGTWPGRIMTHVTNSKGYLTIGLSVNGIDCTRHVHILVAQAFLGPPPTGMEVNHIDTNKVNPRLRNLEYVTSQENADHASRNGLRPTLFLADQVLEIRKAYATGETQVNIAKRYGVKQGVISNIILRKSWAWLR